jgi:hypothetical protein
LPKVSGFCPFLYVENMTTYSAKALVHKGFSAFGAMIEVSNSVRKIYDIAPANTPCYSGVKTLVYVFRQSSYRIVGP